MSKRKSQMAMSAYREEGYLPEALVNFLAFLGWSPGTEEEIFTLDELAARFEIGKVHHGGAVFDKDRLDHLNGVYIRAMTDEQLALRLRSWVPGGGPATTTCCAWCRSSRSAWCGSATWTISSASRGSPTTSSPAGTVPSSSRRRRAVPRTPDGRSRSPARRSPSSTMPTSAPTCSSSAAGRPPRRPGMKAGDFFSPIRVAVTGRTVSPPLFASLELLGRERSLARIDDALGKLTGVAA